MSNIVIVLNERKVDTSILKDMHKILGGSLSNIRSRLLEKVPIVELELFDGEYEEKASLLRKVINLSQEKKLGLELYELPSGDRFETSLLRLESRISVDILQNILDSSDDEIERF